MRLTATFAGNPINLSQLSRDTGYSHSYISRIVSGQREPSLEAARRIYMALGINMDEFVSALDARTTNVVDAA